MNQSKQNASQNASQQSAALCISRVTAIDARCYFADLKHKFFLEMRCGRSCSDPTKNVCEDCSIKTMSTIQWCRKIDHGTIDQPIPDRSHLFGGNWYEDGVRKWGAPSAESIKLAVEHQRKARMISDTVVGPSKVPSPSPDMEPVKRGRKPKIAPIKAAIVPIEVVPSVMPSVIPSAALDIALDVVPSAAPVKKAAIKRPRKPKALTPVKMADPSMVQKEVVLPTHMEQEREEVDTDGFEIEYVKLSVFSLGDATYFRDSKKNKLYKKIKEKTIGSYVGRYDPSTETVHTDVPDSDDEST
jgi:hypothetical protein